MGRTTRFRGLAGSPHGREPSRAFAPRQAQLDPGFRLRGVGSPRRRAAEYQAPPSRMGRLVIPSAAIGAATVVAALADTGIRARRRDAESLRSPRRRVGGAAAFRCDARAAARARLEHDDNIRSTPCLEPRDRAGRVVGVKRESSWPVSAAWIPISAVSGRGFSTRTVRCLTHDVPESVRNVSRSSRPGSGYALQLYSTGSRP